MESLVRFLGKFVLPLLWLTLFLPGVATSHEAGDSGAGGGKQGILFVAMGPSNNFVLIDMATEKVMKAVAGPVNPHGIAVTPDGRYAYLTSRNPEKGKKPRSPGQFPVSVVDVGTGRIVATIDVGGESHHAWMSPDGRRVYVTVPSAEGVAVIDTAANRVVKTIETGFKGNAVATSPDGKRIYVTNKGDDTLSVISGETLEVTKSLEVGAGPDHLAVSPDGKFVYLTAAFANEVWSLTTDPLQVFAKARVGKGPHGIAVSADGRQIFTASRGGARFSVLSGPELKGIYSFDLGKGPAHVSVPPGGRRVYIDDETESKIYVYDPATRKIVHTICLWPEPHETAFFIPSP